jgi:hypothetical protein
MAIPQEMYETWAVEGTLLVGDTTRTLLAARADSTMVLTHMTARVIVSAAQAVNLTIGSVTVKRFAVSEPIASEAFVGPMLKGIYGQKGQALVATPAAAGPSIHFIAEGYWLKNS